MRVLVLSQYYPPENTLMAPTIAAHLARGGHEVKVLTGYPNYPEGRLFDGFSQRWRAKERDGLVDVLRVPLYVDHSQSAVRRTLNYASFGLSAATARGFARGADVIYVYATQMTPALGPWLWRLTGGAPYVLHVQDLWPDSITGSSLMNPGRSFGIVEALLNPWLASTYRRAAATIGIAPTMVNTLIERGSPAERTHMVFNWADESALRTHEVAPPKTAQELTNIVYAGNVGDMQDLDTAVRAAHLARGSGVRLTIVGDGVALNRIHSLCDRLKTTNVEFMGRVPRNRMGEIYANADFALVTLKDLPNFRGTIPSKFQAALSHGMPIITTVQGDLRELVQKHGVGFTADVENEVSLSEAFRAAASVGKTGQAELATKARMTYQNHFSLAAGVGAIERILTSVANDEPTRVGSSNAIA